LIALPDVNVLLALCWKQHIHHEAAHAWFGRAASEGWATCLLTQSSFLRLSLNPKVVHVALSCSEACELLAELVAHPHHHFANSLPSITDRSFAEVASRVRGYQQVPDATLLYLARVHGLKLVTFDQLAGTLSPWPENLELLSVR
jgi:toxin-antitoxin system PIN domain toxin